MTGAKTAVDWLASGGTGSRGLPVGMGAQPPRGRAPARRQGLGRADPAGRRSAIRRSTSSPAPRPAGPGARRLRRRPDGLLRAAGHGGPLARHGVRRPGRGTWIVVPYPGRVDRGVRWLVPPDGSGTLTDPALLELAMHEAAASLATEEDRLEQTADFAGAPVSAPPLPPTGRPRPTASHSDESSTPAQTPTGHDVQRPVVAPAHQAEADAGDEQGAERRRAPRRAAARRSQGRRSRAAPPYATAAVAVWPEG